MGRLDRIPFFQLPKGPARQVARVQRQVLLKWPLGRIAIDSPLKIAAEASVFRGRRAGLPVVVKKFWPRDTRRGFVKDTMKALDHFTALGPHPEFSVNTCLAASQRLGIVVVTYENGTPVNQLLKDPGADRPRLLEQCGAWQRWSNQGKSRHGRLNGSAFAQDIALALQAAQGHPDRALLEDLARALLALLERLKDTPALRSPGHPDFAPRNLIRRPDGGLAGVDIHISGNFFTARQAAKFLVSKDIRDPSGVRPLLYGLDKEELEYYLAQGTVPAEEFDTILVFFIGLTFLNMYARHAGKPRMVRFRHRRVKAYLEDLGQGRRIAP